MTYQEKLNKVLQLKNDLEALEKIEGVARNLSVVEAFNYVFDPSSILFTAQYDNIKLLNKFDEFRELAIQNCEEAKQTIISEIEQLFN